MQSCLILNCLFEYGEDRLFKTEAVSHIDVILQNFYTVGNNNYYL
jgi:hypothetical protein